MRTYTALALIEAAATVVGESIDWPRLVSGMRTALPNLLRYSRRLPRPFVEAALGLGDPALLDELAENDHLLAAMPDVKERVARSGRHLVALRSLRARWDLRSQRLVLAAYQPDGRSLDGWLDRQRAAVAGPTAEGVHLALEAHAAQLTTAERWRAMATLRRLQGPDVVLPEPGLHRTLDELEATAAAWEGTAGAIAELRDGFTDHLPLRPELDWAALAAAHAEQPFAGPAAAALAARPDCPDDLRFALFLADPAAVAPAVPVLTEAMALAPPPKKGAAKAARVVAKRAVADGLDPALLLERMRPAVAVLETIESDALAKLVETHLGTDPGKWCWARAKLNAFAGTVTEFLESAGTAPWPASVTSARQAFLTLLDHAPAGAHLALLERMDDGTVTDLFAKGTWRAEWLDRALSDPRRVLRVALAARPSIDAAAIERLAALDDPELNGLLFRRTAVPHRLRTSLLSGRPLDPAVREQLLALTAGWHGTDALDCADAELQRHIVRHVRVRGNAAQFRLLINLWHRHGQAAAAELLAADLKPANYSASPFNPPVRKRMAQILGRADDAERRAALDALEAEVVAEESPEGQFALLRAERTDHMLLFKETRLWHWDAIIAEHRRSPLPDPILATIATGRGVPASLVEAGRDKLRPWESPAAEEYVAGRPLADILATPREGHDTSWIAAFIAAGIVTWPEVLRQVVPAAHPLDLIGGTSNEVSRAALVELMAATWDGNLDALVLAGEMATTFPGPAAELIAVATAAVAP
ncbi:hypothetical protein [Dactylosporangium sp. CS-033363]|uniref:hypothetical protein n=1 Tax=Dactylosporangium sp. CS-033363 TaxID=3239935 RepID=UPI003D942B9F